MPTFIATFLLLCFSSLRFHAAVAPFKESGVREQERMRDRVRQQLPRRVSCVRLQHRLSNLVLQHFTDGIFFFFEDVNGNNTNKNHLMMNYYVLTPCLRVSFKHNVTLAL